MTWFSVNPGCLDPRSVLVPTVVDTDLVRASKVSEFISSPAFTTFLIAVTST